MSLKILQNPRQRVYCQLCDCDTTGYTTIICHTCNSAIICMYCFFMQVEDNGHKAKHWMTVLDNLNFCVLEPNWTAHDEVILLEAIDTCGIGNWREVRRYLPGKSEKQIEMHFNQYYLAYSDHEKETKSFTFDSLENSYQKLLALKESHGQSSQIKPYRQNFTSFADRIIGSMSKEIQSSIKTYHLNKVGSHPANDIWGEIQGFMPLRNEFENEYGNEVELNLADMEFFPNDSEEEIIIKYQVLQIYNEFLEERKLSRNLTAEHGVLNLSCQAQKEQQMSEAELDCYELFKPILCLQSNAENQELIERLVDDARIKMTFQQYKILKQMSTDDQDFIEDFDLSKIGLDELSIKLDQLFSGSEECEIKASLSKGKLPIQNHGHNKPCAIKFLGKRPADHQNHAMDALIDIEKNFIKQSKIDSQKYEFIKQKIVDASKQEESLFMANVESIEGSDEPTIQKISEFLLHHD